MKRHIYKLLPQILDSSKNISKQNHKIQLLKYASSNVETQVIWFERILNLTIYKSPENNILNGWNLAEMR